MHDHPRMLARRRFDARTSRLSTLKSAVLAAMLAVGCGETGDASPQDMVDGSTAPVTGSDLDATLAGGMPGGQSSGGGAGGVPGMPTGGDDAGARPGGAGSRADAAADGGGGGRGGVQDGGGVSGGLGGASDSGSSRGSDDAGGSMPSSGCGMDPPAAGNATVQVNGMDRQYVLALPQGYDKSRAYPVILAFHGAGLSGPQFRSFFNLVTPVGTDGIVVYPTGTGGQWDVRRDVPFVDALLAKLQSSLCVDTRRIFATGHSNGAFFTNAIGCQRGDVLRGIAPMSGGQQQQASSCKGAIAVWISHGDADNIVATSYGTMTRDFWVRRNMCNTAMATPVMPSPCVEYQGCASGAPVRYCEYPGNHNLMANSAQTIWSFFKQF